MEAASLDYLPRARIPAVLVNITRQYILQQSLQALGISDSKTTTHDFLSDDIIAVVSFEIPPHGDFFFPKKEQFYGEPCKARDEAIESAHETALRYLQRSDIVFIDDGNLNELTEGKRSLACATFWADELETKCASKKVEISAMAKHIQLINLQPPLSPPADSDMEQENVPQNVASPPYEDGIQPDHILPQMASPSTLDLGINEVFPQAQFTPLHDTGTSESLATVAPKGLLAVGLNNTSDRAREGDPAKPARRALFSDC